MYLTDLYELDSNVVVGACVSYVVPEWLHMAEPGDQFYLL